MLKALENPDYKKILEKVVVNRHPEAKSVEEALKLEVPIKMITLEDICALFEYPLYQAGLGNFFDWKFNETLENQSDNTIKAICNILFNQ